MKECVVVLGMHRSGTSVLAGFVSLQGFYIGATEMPPQNYNPKGFFENQKIYHLNESILQDQGGGWDDYSFTIQDIKQKDLVGYELSIREVIKEEFGSIDRIFIKDPRMCLLFPLWEKVLKEMGYNIRVIFAWRSPMEVAHSLEVRNKMAVEKSLMIWSHHFFQAEKNSRNYECFVVRYNNDFSDMDTFFNKLGEFLGVDPTEEMYQSARELYAPKLKHHLVELKSITNELPAYLKGLITVLMANDITNKEKLDELHDDFYYSKTYYLYDQALQKEELVKRSLNILEQQEQINKLRQLNDERVNELESSVKELAVITDVSNHKDQKICQLESLLNNAQIQHDEQKLELDSIKRKLESTKRELEVIKREAGAKIVEVDTIRQQFKSTKQKFDNSQSDLESTKHELEASKQESEARKQSLDLLELRFANAEQIFQTLFHDKARYKKLQKHIRGENTLIKKITTPFAKKETKELLKEKKQIAKSGLFSPLYYLSTYSDIWKSGVDPLFHYCKYGWNERRRPSASFNIDSYENDIAEVSEQEINPLLRFIQDSGPLSKEKEIIGQSGLFSPLYYLSTNPDVKEAGVDPLTHFCEQGWKDGRQPSENFDIGTYVNDNPWVYEENINPLAHYIERRSFENISKRIKYSLTRYFSKTHKEANSNKVAYVYHEPVLTNDVLKEIKNFSRSPLISILVQVYNVEKKWLENAIKSIENQWYQKWEINLTYDASDNPETINYLKGINDSRIKIKPHEENSKNSHAIKKTLEVAAGEYIVLMGQNDEIAPDALYEVVKSINETDADFIYSDEDILGSDNKYSNPYFKPDFSPDMFLSQNYVSRLCVINKSLVEKVGGWTLELGGFQDYDLYLKVLEHTNRIVHIPTVLYHTRNTPGSTEADSGGKYDSQEAGLRCIGDALKRRAIDAEVVNSNDPGTYRIKYAIQNDPLVSIVIPFKDMPDLLKMCINSILEKSTYEHYEIIGISNNSEEPKTFAAMEQLKAKDKRVAFYEYNQSFNYSAINNYAVKKHIKGKHVLLLNNDIEIITPEWIEELLMFSQRPDVGAVGAKLYYPDDTIQHAGVIIGIGQTAGHSHKRLPRSSSGYLNRLNIVQNLSAVTAACLMVKKSVYDEVKGLNEKDLKVAFNDVDFCLRIREAGYLNVFTPFCEAYHYESISRGYEDNPEKLARFNLESKYLKKRHMDILKQGDPYYNKNLTLSHEDFQLKHISQDRPNNPKQNSGLAKEFKHEIIKNKVLRSRKNKYLCIFSHFDKDGIIDEYVVNYIKALNTFADIVFVSTAETMQENELDKIETFCNQVIIKKNYGYDFGAWKTGLELSHIELSQYENLILCNDSVYGPLYDLKKLLDEAMIKYDVFSITDSYEQALHLQSYFVTYSRTAFSHKLFKEFWDGFGIYKHKGKLVKENEVKFSASLIHSDLSVSALCKAEDGNQLNQLHFYWDKLILDKKCPFIKIELLRDNPRNINLRNWKKIIKQTDYDVKLIENHLKRMRSDFRCSLFLFK